MLKIPSLCGLKGRVTISPQPPRVVTVTGYWGRAELQYDGVSGNVDVTGLGSVARQWSAMVCETY